jgi:hypothetical protein
MLRGDQVYEFAVPVSHAGPYQAKLNNGEELEAGQQVGSVRRDGSIPALQSTARRLYRR